MILTEKKEKEVKKIKKDKAKARQGASRLLRSELQQGHSLHAC